VQPAFSATSPATCAILGPQARQQAAGKAQRAADARAIEARRGVEDAPEEPQALGHRRSTQVQRPFDPRADDLHATRHPAVLRQVRDERAAYRDRRRRQHRPAQADARDVVVGKGEQHQLLGRAQGHERRQIDAINRSGGKLGRRRGHARAP
jgi:hypothetical protein